MIGMMMTLGSKRFGRPPEYGFDEMDIGETITMSAPTPEDVKRIARNTSQYGIRKDKQLMCRTDRRTRIMTIKRIR